MVDERDEVQAGRVMGVQRTVGGWTDAHGWRRTGGDRYDLCARPLNSKRLLPCLE